MDGERYNHMPLAWICIIPAWCSCAYDIQATLSACAMPMHTFHMHVCLCPPPFMGPSHHTYLLHRFPLTYHFILWKKYFDSNSTLNLVDGWWKIQPHATSLDMYYPGLMHMCIWYPSNPKPMCHAHAYFPYACMFVPSTFHGSLPPYLSFALVSPHLSFHFVKNIQIF
jgi:hypothetical protein